MYIPVFIICIFVIFLTVCCFSPFLFKHKNKEQVNHPAHYQKNGKECIEVMEEKYGPKAVFDFCICNAFKYEWRAGFKDGNSVEQDLAKAKWYKEYAKKICAKYPKEFSIQRYG